MYLFCSSVICAHGIMENELQNQKNKPNLDYAPYWPHEMELSCPKKIQFPDLKMREIIIHPPSVVVVFSNCVDCSMPGSLVLQHLLELAQTHVH